MRQYSTTPTPAPSESDQKRTRLASAALMSLFLVACGGGGGGGTTSTAPVVTPATTITFESVVTDGSGGKVEGATVTVATDEGTVTTTTQASGAYSFDVKAADLPTTNTPVVLIISKEGYKTQVVEYVASELKAGQTYSVPTTQQTPLVQLAANELSPPEGAVLIRLGDGNAPGSNNAFLQAKTSGSKKAIKLGTIEGIAASVVGSHFSTAYPTFTLSITFRGLQADECADKVSVFQSTALDGSAPRSNVTAYLPLSDIINSPLTTFRFGSSDLTGQFTPFNLAAIPTGDMTVGKGALWVEIESGTCPGDPLDDFEFVDIHGTFNPAT